MDFLKLVLGELSILQDYLVWFWFISIYCLDFASDTGEIDMSEQFSSINLMLVHHDNLQADADLDVLIANWD